MAWRFRIFSASRLGGGSFCLASASALPVTLFQSASNGEATVAAPLPTVEAFS